MTAIICHAMLLGSGGIDVDAQDIIDHMSPTPDAIRKGAINAFVTSLKLSGVWDKLDVLNVFAAHASSPGRMTWKNVIGKEWSLSTMLGSTTFEVDVGVVGASGGSTTNRVETTFDPAEDGINYQQDDFSVGIYLHTNPTTTNDELFGAADVFTLSQVRARYDVAQDKIQAIGECATPETSALNSSELGLLVLQRPDSSKFEVYNSSGKIIDKAAASIAQTAGNTNNFWLFGCSGTGTATSDAKISMFFAGACLTPTEISDLNTAAETYMAAL